MNPDLATALELQELDMRIAALRQEIAALPRQIAAIEKQLEGHQKQLELDKTALAANHRDRKRLEGEAQVHQQKISKLKDQMMQAKTNDQYRAFQHEIEYCETEIRKCEDRILELMMEAEMLEANVAVAETALAEEKRVVEARKAETRARKEADEAELKQALARRQDASAKLPGPLLATYERLRAKHRDGVAIAEVREGRCVACNMLLRPQLFQDIKTSAEVQACENCKRLLYVPPPAVDVAAEMNA